ncbi:MAG TPA: ATP-binding cassette domain-containing protein [Rubrobacteraceae bacterium]|nr:ATP-binding cassette domain-containing protein [Rubrobacteraceae bacterium]
MKYHGGDLKILSGATLAVESGEKIGLVGRNGAGKTTLLNVLSGNLEPDGGAVERIGGAKVGMTSQSLYLGTKRSVEEEMLSAFESLMRREGELKSLEAELSGEPSQTLLERYGRLQAEFDRDGGYEYRARAASALSSLGFDPEDWKRPVSSSSGGEQSRIALARLLPSEPDLVLLESRRTTWTCAASSGWRTLSRTRRAPSSSSRTTATSWTPSPGPSWSSTTAGSPATPATTPSTSPRRRPGTSNWRAKPKQTPSAASSSNALSRRTGRRRRRQSRPRANRSS